MRRAVVALAFLAQAALAACIDLAPSYHRPAMPVPAAFPTGPAYPSAAVSQQPVVGWRDFFADPKLQTVIERALADNRDLRVAVANIAVARAQYDVQRAYRFPTITADASATYAQEPNSVVGGGAFAGAGGSGAFHEQLFSLTAGTSAYQLDLFGKVRDLTLRRAISPANTPAMRLRSRSSPKWPQITWRSAPTGPSWPSPRTPSAAARRRSTSFTRGSAPEWTPSSTSARPRPSFSRPGSTSRA
jgi:hypothetical protein